MIFDAEAVFNAEFDKAIAADVARSGFPVERWQRAGIEKPKTTIGKWRGLGPRCVQQFIDWYEASDYQLWITPDGRPAVELELLVMFGTIPVRMFIDLVLINRNGLLVIDAKSSAKPPPSLQQVGMYACGIELAYGREWRPLWGAYFMARDGSITPVPLTEYRYSAEFFTRELALMDQAAKDGLFISNVGKDCTRCPVAYACAAVGGSEAADYDPSHPLFGKERTALGR